MNDPKKSTVLVIDDEIQIRRLLRVCLEKNGYDVVEAARRRGRASAKSPAVIPTWCCWTLVCRTWTA